MELERQRQEQHTCAILRLFFVVVASYFVICRIKFGAYWSVCERHNEITRLSVLILRSNGARKNRKINHTESNWWIRTHFKFIVATVFQFFKWFPLQFTPANNYGSTFLQIIFGLKKKVQWNHFFQAITHRVTKLKVFFSSL